MVLNRSETSISHGFRTIHSVKRPRIDKPPSFRNCHPLSLCCCCHDSGHASYRAFPARTPPTGDTWARIAREMDRMAAVTLTGTAGTVVQATEPTETQRAILSACKVSLPPRITSLHPL